MVFKNIILFVLCSALFCESAFVDTIQKCSKDDTECLTQNFQNIIANISDKGVKELDIPPGDPTVVKNTTFSILDVLDLTFDGVIKGLKKAVVNKFTLNFDEGVALLDLVCDFVIKGKYTASSSSPVLKSLLSSDSVHGNGDGKVKIDKLHLILELPFYIIKKGEDIFLVRKKDKHTYSFDINNMEFKVNNLYLGDKESSAVIVKMLNENWKSLTTSFGKYFIDKAFDFIGVFLDKILSNVPVKHLIIEDLSSYVKS